MEKTRPQAPLSSLDKPPHLILFIALLLALLGSSLISHAADNQKKKGAAVISRITIRGSDIFDFESDTSLRRFPYTWINTLHIKTNDVVIKRELLFKVGDKVDPFLIRETERNLRALPFIRSARVAQFPQRDGTVALVVYASDSWTTEPQVNLSGINGVDTVEVGFKEKNLFGWGKTVEMFYNNGDNFIERSYGFKDPRLFGSRWQMTAKAVNATNDEIRNLKIEQPFYSADSRWSARGFHETRVQNVDEFVNQQKVSSFEQKKEINEAFAGIKVGQSRDIINHIGLRLRKENRNFERTDKTATNRAIPEPETLRTLFVDMESIRNDFVELTHIEKMTRIEDINLGPALNLSPGINPNIGSDKENFSQLEFSFEKKHLINHAHLIQGKFNYSGRDTFQEAENERYAAALKFYHRTFDWSTLVINTRAEVGKNLDADNQIKLGANGGLRSFEEDSIIGTKSWLLNIENRLFFIDELWNLFAVGGAVFYDTGYSWARGRPVAFSDLKSEVGMGLRLGLTRSSNEVVLRFDVAYRLQKNRADDPGFVFTFGTGQAF